MCAKNGIQSQLVDGAGVVDDGGAGTGFDETAAGVLQVDDAAAQVVEGAVGVQADRCATDVDGAAVVPCFGDQIIAAAGVGGGARGVQGAISEDVAAAPVQRPLDVEGIGRVKVAAGDPQVRAT